jgi:hypothetical protein
MTDEFGEPMSQVSVQAQQSRFVASSGKRELVAVGSNDPFSGTNDLGEIRLYGLPPGEYYLSGSLRNPITLGVGDATLTILNVLPRDLCREAQRVPLGSDGNSRSFPLAAGRRASAYSCRRRQCPGAAVFSLTQRVGTAAFPRGMPVQPTAVTMPSVMPGDYTPTRGPSSTATSPSRAHRCRSK